MYAEVVVNNIPYVAYAVVVDIHVEQTSKAVQASQPEPVCLLGLQYADECTALYGDMKVAAFTNVLL